MTMAVAIAIGAIIVAIIGLCCCRAAHDADIAAEQQFKEGKVDERS